ncbi:unnamed protein product [Effrenium voratum]|nr:unnamed protein product [Effrenium voratum]
MGCEWDGSGSSTGWEVPQDTWGGAWKKPHRPPSKIRREKEFNSWKDDVRKELAVKDVLIKKLEEELKVVKAEKDEFQKKFQEKAEDNVRVWTELEAERRWTASFKADHEVLYRENAGLRSQVAKLEASVPASKRPKVDSSKKSPDPPKKKE